MESLQRYNQLSQSVQADREFWKKAMTFCLDRIRQNIPVFGSKYPAPASLNNVYQLIDNTDWTASFWNGMLWQAYQYSGDQTFCTAAENTMDDYTNRLEKKINTDTHDLGFLYILSAKAQYLLTGDSGARELALKAADELMLRYHENAGVIQAWGDLKDPGQRGRIIIDCLMNIPLLFWASTESGKALYADAAKNHLQNTRKYLIRENDSTFHTYYFDAESGKALRGTTAQGHSDDSSWARGQAWGVYGLALNFRYTRDPELLEDAKRLAHYFLNRLPDDLICYWDLDFTSGPEERDSSAAAILACGLLELSSRLPVSDPGRRLYENAALHIMQTLTESYTTESYPSSSGILLHGVYAKPDGKGVDECTVWGDYFYVEGLVRILQNRELFW